MNTADTSRKATDVDKLTEALPECIYNAATLQKFKPHVSSIRTQVDICRLRFEFLSDKDSHLFFKQILGWRSGLTPGGKHVC